MEIKEAYEEGWRQNGDLEETWQNSNAKKAADAIEINLKALEEMKQGDYVLIEERTKVFMDSNPGEDDQLYRIAGLGFFDIKFLKPLLRAAISGGMARVVVS